jgi:hypothetical protein
MERDATPSTARRQFNTGYHDGAACAYGTWHRPGEQFDCPDYATGWYAGFRDARTGRYTGETQSAWERFRATPTGEAA